MYTTDFAHSYIHVAILHGNLHTQQEDHAAMVCYTGVYVHVCSVQSTENPQMERKIYMCVHLHVHVHAMDGLYL